MTTGRINQVATSQWMESRRTPNPMFAVGVDSNCVLASVSQLSSTTAPLQRQSPMVGSARIAGSAVPAHWDSISTRITAEQRHQVREAGINGFKNHKSIQLQRKRIGHPGTRTERMRSLKKAKKETQTRKLANQEFAWCHLGRPELLLHRFVRSGAPVHQHERGWSRREERKFNK